ncbi:MAG: protease-4 [Haloarculaceae archaeon]|jgi:protease-4
MSVITLKIQQRVMLDRNDVTSARVAMYVVVIVLGLVAGLVLAPVVLDATVSTDSSEPTVAVIDFRGPTSNANVAGAAELLRSARNNESVESVVIRIDSPGGPVDASEEFYLAVNRTAREMPVVTYVEGAAASGGYFGIVASDEIHVKPSSNVGSIGVVVSAPLSAVEQAQQQQETFIRTGPDKAQISKDGIREDLEALQSAFVGTVMEHRSESLTLSRQDVARGDVYLGAEAVENGFADRVGDLSGAIERAAELSDDIEGEEYDVDFKELPSVEIDVTLPPGAEGSDGDVIYVESDEQGQEFVQPVEYYAVWGVPAPEGNTTDAGVIIDG